MADLLKVGFYQVLGVEPAASPTEIKKAYYKLSLVHHPDKGGDPEVFKYIVLCYETLIDKKEKKLAVNWDDDLIKGTALTRDGAVIHPNFKPKTAA